MAPRRKVNKEETAAARMKRLEKELEQARQDAALEATANAEKGPSAVAMTVAVKELIARFKKDLPEDAPDWMKAIIPQSFPKERLIGKRFGLSETEIHNAMEKGRKAIAGL